MSQLELIPRPPSQWETSDDWETPARVAKQIAGLIKPWDFLIVEPSAGTGQIARHLPAGALCIENNSCRCSIGAETVPLHKWMLEDFLAVSCEDLGVRHGVDLIIGNPPFSLWTDFLLHSLTLVRTGGRVVFVGPCDQFHKPTELNRLGQWRDRITVIPHPIVGRVAYLKDRVQVSGRQIYDSIFEVVKL
jgi:hypothetical protein